LTLGLLGRKLNQPKARHGPFEAAAGKLKPSWTANHHHTTLQFSQKNNAREVYRANCFFYIDSLYYKFEGKLADFVNLKNWKRQSCALWRH